MSELKAYIGLHPSDHTITEYYFKSEVDKVIVELKAQKAQAEDDCAYWKMNEGNASNAMHETEEYAMQLYNEARHHKYKRCLAMAEWCNSEMGRETFACFRPRHTKEVWREEHKYWAKWRKIWFELYKKLKPNNSTAQ